MPKANTLEIDLNRSLAENERQIILEVVRRNHGNRRRSYEDLDLIPQTLRNKLALYESQGFHVPPPWKGASK